MSPTRHARLLVMSAALCLTIRAGMALAQQAAPKQPEGIVHLDVVVTDAAGKPVGGLLQQNFKLLDDGDERGIASFAAYDGSTAKADPPVQMILVIDCLNDGFVEMGYIRQGLLKFLRQNNGRLAQPTTIVRFGLSGIQVLSKPSTDGNALAGIVDQIGATTKPKGLDDFSLSLKALSTLVNQVANQPGRKQLIWLGPGWPTPVPSPQVVRAIDERDQRANYHLMVQLAKAMQEGQIALYGGYTGTGFYMRDYLKPVRKSANADPRDLALEVLAVKSGGHGELPQINRDSVVTDELNNFVAEAGMFYALSFDPPRAREDDEFHELKVVVDKPGLTVRTVNGYYDEPEYFRTESKKEKKIIVQEPIVEEPSALAPVTVEQLVELVSNSKGNRDSNVARELERLQLTERLNTPKLVALSSELPGKKSKTALMAMADASVFLEPPAAEIPQIAVPDMAEQTQMMAHAVDYLKTIIPKLPNFYAKRSTTSLHGVIAPKDQTGSHKGVALHPEGEYKATVYYRDGNEVVREEGAQEHGLITRGTFGPILSTVIRDAALSNTTQWSRWEEGPNGPMSVFRFQVPQAESHYQISGNGEFGVMSTTAYHGEIGIDPGSGTILRLALEADPALGSSTERADIMVEYGSVTIGGKMYTCPVRSVSYSVGMLSVPVSLDVETSWERESARLNDVVFSDYHVFRSEMRIVP